MTLDAAPHDARRAELPITTLDELNRRFLPHPDAPPRQQYMRALMLAVAQWMLVHLPDGPQKWTAIDQLVLVAVLADEALAPR